MTHFRPSLGIVAGGGILPGVLARRLNLAGYLVVMAGLRGQWAGPFPEGTVGRCFGVAQIGAMISFFNKWGVTKIFFAGSVARRGLWRHLQPDRIGLSMLVKWVTRGDDAYLRLLAGRIENFGIGVGDGRPYIPDLLVAPGSLGQWGPGAWWRVRISPHLAAIRSFYRQDRGQAVLVKPDKVVFEDRGGTDKLILRAGAPGDLLIKMPKLGQDMRFDVPAIGPTTVELAGQKGLAGMLLEAGGVMVLDRAQVVARADSLRMPVVGIEPGEQGLKLVK